MLAFDSDVEMGGLSSPELSQESKDILVITMAITMNIGVGNVVFVSSTATEQQSTARKLQSSPLHELPLPPQRSSLLLRASSFDGERSHKAEVSQDSSTVTTVLYIVTATLRTEVSLVDYPDAQSPTELYNSLTNLLAIATTQNNFTNTLLAVSESFNSTALANVSVSSIKLSDPIVVEPPSSNRNEQESAPPTFPKWAIALLVVPLGLLGCGISLFVAKRYAVENGIILSKKSDKAKSMRDFFDVEHGLPTKEPTSDDDYIGETGHDIILKGSVSVDFADEYSEKNNLASVSVDKLLRQYHDAADNAPLPFNGSASVDFLDAYLEEKEDIAALPADYRQHHHRAAEKKPLPVPQVSHVMSTDSNLSYNNKSLFNVDSAASFHFDSRGSEAKGATPDAVEASPVPQRPMTRVDSFAPKSNPLRIPSKASMLLDQAEKVVVDTHSQQPHSPRRLFDDQAHPKVLLRRGSMFGGKAAAYVDSKQHKLDKEVVRNGGKTVHKSPLEKWIARSRDSFEEVFFPSRSSSSKKAPPISSADGASIHVADTSNLIAEIDDDDDDDVLSRDDELKVRRVVESAAALSRKARSRSAGHTQAFVPHHYPDRSGSSSSSNEESDESDEDFDYVEVTRRANKFQSWYGGGAPDVATASMNQSASALSGSLASITAAGVAKPTDAVDAAAVEAAAARYEKWRRDNDLRRSLSEEKESSIFMGDSAAVMSESSNIPPNEPFTGSVDDVDDYDAVANAVAKYDDWTSSSRAVIERHPEVHQYQLQQHDSNSVFDASNVTDAIARYNDWMHKNIVRRSASLERSSGSSAEPASIPDFPPRHSSSPGTIIDRTKQHPVVQPGSPLHVDRSGSLLPPKAIGTSLPEQHPEQPVLTSPTLKQQRDAAVKSRTGHSPKQQQQLITQSHSLTTNSRLAAGSRVDGTGGSSSEVRGIARWARKTKAPPLPEELEESIEALYTS
jgi:hypothetical protein